MGKRTLTKTESAALRGLAILGIVLHNYCHWLGLAVKENEYTFDLDKSHRLWWILQHPDMYLPVHLLSFFGHYGVPVFLFLSGYGLFKKYENDAERVGAWSFIRVHYLKLLRMMIVGFVLFTMLDAITPGRHPYQAWDIIAQIGMFINILPHPDRIIWPGPYWFFGLMMELYLVYRWVLYRRSPWITVALVVLCWLMQAVCMPESEALNRIRYNFTGGMLPFGAGLLYARKEVTMGKRGYAVVALLSTIAVFACGFHFHLWLWIPLFVVTGCVSMVRLLPDSLLKILSWTGSISAALFVTHPLVRKVFIPISRQGDVYAGLLLYLIACIALAWAAEMLMKKIPTPQLKRKTP